MQQSRGKPKIIPVTSEKWIGEFETLREEHVAMESDYFVDVKSLGLFLDEASVGNQPVVVTQASSFALPGITPSAPNATLTAPSIAASTATSAQQSSSSNFRTENVASWKRALLDYHDGNEFAHVCSNRVALVRRLQAVLRLRRGQVFGLSDSKGLVKSKDLAASLEKPLSVVDDVPVMVRLSVLTLFPMLELLQNCCQRVAELQKRTDEISKRLEESLAKNKQEPSESSQILQTSLDQHKTSLALEELSYNTLCQRCVTVVLNVLETLGPLALRDEPADCVQAFADFIAARVSALDHVIDSDENARIVDAMVSFCVARGGACNMIRILDCLMRVEEKREKSLPPSSSLSSTPLSAKQRRPVSSSGRDYSGFALRIGTCLQHLAQASAAETKFLVPHEKTVLDTFFFDSQVRLDCLKRYGLRSSLACDQTFLYIHNPNQGLVKIGSGQQASILGHLYAYNATFSTVPAPVTTAASTLAATSDIRGLIAVGDSLYFYQSSFADEEQPFLPVLAVINKQTLVKEYSIALAPSLLPPTPKPTPIDAALTTTSESTSKTGVADESVASKDAAKEGESKKKEEASAKPVLPSPLVRKEACRVCSDGQFLYLVYEVNRSEQQQAINPNEAAKTAVAEPVSQPSKEEIQAAQQELVKRTFDGLTKEHVSDNLEELIFELLSQGVSKRMILGELRVLFPEDFEGVGDEEIFSDDEQIENDPELEAELKAARESLADLNAAKELLAGALQQAPPLSTSSSAFGPPTASNAALSQSSGYNLFGEPVKKQAQVPETGPVFREYYVDIFDLPSCSKTAFAPSVATDSTTSSTTAASSSTAASSNANVTRCTATLAPVRTLRLSPVPHPHCCASPGTVLSEFKFLPTFFSHGEFYCDGTTLYIVAPPNTFTAGKALTLSHVIAFSLRTGDLLGYLSLDLPFSPGTSFVYSKETSLLHSYNNHLRKSCSWYFQPREIGPEVSSLEPVASLALPPRDSLSLILSHLDSLARQHPLYGSCFILENLSESPAPAQAVSAYSSLASLTKSSRSSRDEMLIVAAKIPDSCRDYCEDADIGIFKQLHALLLPYSLPPSSTDASAPVLTSDQQSIVRLGLALLRINLFGFLSSNVPLSQRFQKAGFKDGGSELLSMISALLLRLIRRVSLPLSLSVEVMKTFILGFNVFKRTTSERLAFLLELLNEAQSNASINERLGQFINLLFSQLVVWDQLPSLLQSSLAELEAEQLEKEKSEKLAAILLSGSKDPATTVAESPRAVLRHVSSTALAKKLSASPSGNKLGESVSSLAASSKLLSSPLAATSSTGKLRGKPELKKPEPVPSGPVLHQLAFPFLQSLLARGLEECTLRLANIDSPVSSHSASVSLLLELQSIVLGGTFGPVLLLKYSNTFLSQMKTFLASFLENVTAKKYSAAHINALQDSLVGLGLRAYVNSLPTVLTGLNVSITACNNAQASNLASPMLAFPMANEPEAALLASFSTLAIDLTKSLVVLAETMHAISAAVLPAREINEEYLANCRAHCDRRKPAIYETPHPMPSGFNCVQTVAVRGAKQLIIHFDRRSVVSSPDALYVTPGDDHPQYSQTEEVKITDAFPTKPIIFDGDSVTFEYKYSGSFPIWGFRVLVAEHIPRDLAKPLVSSWFLDLQASLTWVISANIGDILEQRDTGITDKEVLVLLETGLFAGGFESEAETKSAPPSTPEQTTSTTTASSTASSTAHTAPLSVTDNLVAFLSAPSEAEDTKAWAWLAKGEKRQSYAFNKYIDQVEKTTFAVLLKFFSLYPEFRELARHVAQSGSELPTPSHLTNEKMKTFYEHVMFVYRKAKTVGQTVRERCVQEKLWLGAIEDNDGIDFFENFSNEKLKALCEWKKVPFDVVHPNDAIKELFTLLQQEQQAQQAQPSETVVDVYETNTKLILEKLNFLLRKVASANEDSDEATLYFRKLTEKHKPGLSHSQKSERSALTSRAAREGLMSASSSISPSVSIQPPKPAARRAFLLEDAATQSSSITRNRLMQAEETDEDGVMAQFARKSALSKSMNHASESDRKSEKRAAEERRDFHLRVQGLNSWVKSYRAWKSWETNGIGKRRTNLDGAHPLLSSLIAFVTSPASVPFAALEQSLAQQNRRALHRVEGYQLLHKMLAVKSPFTVVIQQSITPLHHFVHYSERLPVCRRDTRRRLMQAFSVAFDDFLGLIQSSALDASSRHLALTVCGLAFQAEDAFLLLQSHVFPILCEFFYLDESDTLLQQQSQNQIMTVAQLQATEIKIVPIEKKPAGDETAKKPAEEKSESTTEASSTAAVQSNPALLLARAKQKMLQEEQKRRKRREDRELAQAAWIAFNLIASQCVAWNYELTQPLALQAPILTLQGQVYDSIFYELERICSKFEISTRARNAAISPQKKDGSKPKADSLSPLKLVTPSSESEKATTESTSTAEKKDESAATTTTATTTTTDKKDLRDVARKRGKSVPSSSSASGPSGQQSTQASSVLPLQQPVVEADGVRCKQLLALMEMLLTDNPLSRKYFSEARCVHLLLSLLSTNLPTASLLLVFQLLKQLLREVESEKVVDETYNVLLNNLGALQFHLKKQPSKEDGRKPATTPEERDKSFKRSLEAFASKVNVSLPPQMPQQAQQTQPRGRLSKSGGVADHLVVLYSWSGTEAALIEHCKPYQLNPTGETTKAEKKESLFGTSSGDSATATAKSTASTANAGAAYEANGSYYGSIDDHGFAIVLHGSLEQCNKLATELATAGACVSIVEESKFDKLNPNDRLNQSLPVYWLDSTIASQLCSEYINLIRSLSHASDVWYCKIREKIELSLLDSMTLCSAIGQQSSNATTSTAPSTTAQESDSPVNEKTFVNVVASLNIIGGYDETLRVGGTAVVTSPHGESRTVRVTRIDTTKRLAHVTALVPTPPSATLSESRGSAASSVASSAAISGSSAKGSTQTSAAGSLTVSAANVASPSSSKDAGKPETASGPIDLSLLTPCMEFELNPAVTTSLAPVLLKCLLTFISPEFTTQPGTISPSESNSALTTPSDVTDSTTAPTTTTTTPTQPTKLESYEAELVSASGEKREEKERAVALPRLTQRQQSQAAKRARMPYHRMLLGLLQVNALSTLNALLHADSKLVQVLCSADTFFLEKFNVLLNMANTPLPASLEPFALIREFDALKKSIWNHQSFPSLAVDPSIAMPPPPAQGPMTLGLLSTTPVPSSLHAYRMRDIVPYAPCAYSNKLGIRHVLPTCLSIATFQQDGLLIQSADERRQVQHFASKTDTESKDELVVFGNAPVPLHTDYYFELTVMTSTPESIISIGIGPANTNHRWEPGSLRYRSDKKKCYFATTTLKTDNYGEVVKSKQTIGCGWTAETHSLYFTHNGSSLPVAFKNAFLDATTPNSTIRAIFPCVGVRNARVMINFGQQAFKYKVPLPKGEESGLFSLGGSGSLFGGPSTSLSASTATSATTTATTTASTTTEKTASLAGDKEAEKLVPLEPASITAKKPEEKPKTEEQGLFADFFGDAPSNANANANNNAAPLNSTMSNLGAFMQASLQSPQPALNPQPILQQQSPLVSMANSAEAKPAPLTAVTGLSATSSTASTASSSATSSNQPSPFGIGSMVGMNLYAASEPKKEDEKKPVEKKSEKKAAVKKEPTAEEAKQQEDLDQVLMITQVSKGIALMALKKYQYNVEMAVGWIFDQGDRLVEPEAEEDEGEETDPDEEVEVVEEEPEAPVKEEKKEKAAEKPDATEKDPFSGFTYAPVSPQASPQTGATALTTASTATTTIATEATQAANAQSTVTLSTSTATTVTSTTSSTQSNANTATATTTSVTTASTSGTASTTAASSTTAVTAEKAEPAKPSFGHYYLSSSFSYLAPNEAMAEGDENDEISLIKKKWEKDIIPTMTQAMTRAGFTDMESEQYLYLLYQQLNVGNEKLASDVYKKAVGRAVDNKLLYATSKTAASTERTRVAPLTFLDFQVGSMLVVKDRTWGKNNKDYVDYVIGCVGCVRAIDYQREEVLLSFYDSDEALYFEWWFPMMYLKLPTAPTSATSGAKGGTATPSGNASNATSPPPLSPSALTAASISARPMNPLAASNPVLDMQVSKLAQCLGDLSLVYAHRIVLAFVLNDACALSLKAATPSTTGSEKTESNQQVSSSESIPTAVLAPTIDVDTVLLLTGRYLMTGLESECANPLLSLPDPSRPLEKAKQRLLQFYNSSDAASKLRFTACLSQLCTRLVRHTVKRVETDSVAVARSSQLSKAELIDSAASQVGQGLASGGNDLCNLVVFNRGETRIPLKDREFTIGFFEDEACTLPLATFSTLAAIRTVTLPKRFYHRMVGKKDLAGCAYAFTVIPVTADFPLALWILRLLIAHCHTPGLTQTELGNQPATPQQQLKSGSLEVIDRTLKSGKKRPTTSTATTSVASDEQSEIVARAVSTHALLHDLLVLLIDLLAANSAPSPLREALYSIMARLFNRLRNDLCGLPSNRIREFLFSDAVTAKLRLLDDEMNHFNDIETRQKAVLRSSYLQNLIEFSNQWKEYQKLINTIAPSDEKPALLTSSDAAVNKSAQKNSQSGDGEKSPPTATATPSQASSSGPNQQRFFSSFASFSQYLEFFDYQQQQLLFRQTQLNSAKAPGKNYSDISANPYAQSAIERIVASAYKELMSPAVQKSLTARTVLIKHIPVTHKKSLAELKNYLHQMFESLNIVIEPASLFIPVNAETDETKTWCVVETKTVKGANDVATALKDKKLPLRFASAADESESKASSTTASPMSSDGASTFKFDLASTASTTTASTATEATSSTATASATTEKTDLSPFSFPVLESTATSTATTTATPSTPVSTPSIALITSTGASATHTASTAISLQAPSKKKKGRSSSPGRASPGHSPSQSPSAFKFNFSQFIEPPLLVVVKYNDVKDDDTKLITEYLQHLLQLDIAPINAASHQTSELTSSTEPVDSPSSRLSLNSSVGVERDATTAVEGEREVSLKSSAKLRKSLGGSSDGIARSGSGFQTKLSRRCQAVIREKFDRYVDRATGLLMSEHFDRFAAIRQLFPADLGSDEEIGLMVDLMFPVDDASKDSEKEALSPSTEARAVEGALSFEDVLKVYTLAMQNEPQKLFDEFFAFGYDQKLCHNHFLSLEDAVAAERQVIQLGTSSLDVYDQLVKYVESIFSQVAPDVSSPLDISLSYVGHFTAKDAQYSTYPLLLATDTRLLRLRLEILKQFNLLFKANFQFVNMNGDCRIASLIGHHRYLIYHTVKMEAFYQVVEATASIEGKHPVAKLNRKKIQTAVEKLKKDNTESTEEFYLQSTAFGHVFAQLQHVDPALYRQKKPLGQGSPHHSLTVNFEGELVEGLTGPYRQFFTDCSKELQDPHHLLPLLAPCPNAVSSVGRNRDKFVLAASAASKLQLKLFTFLGRMMGMVIRTGAVLPLSLTGVWKPLVGYAVTKQDLRDQDELFGVVLEKLKTMSQTEFEETMIVDNFTVALSDTSRRLLKPNGDNIPLTYGDIGEWIRLAYQTRLSENNLQLQHILLGIGEVIPLPLLSLLSPQELEWEVCGKPFIDINLLKRHTKYSGELTATSPVVVYLWQVLHSLTQEERCSFIRFAYAQERLPADDQEFTRTQTKMYVKPYQGKTAGNPDKVFPKADTCFFHLCLPNYSSAEVLKERLLTAILYAADSMNADNPQQQRNLGVSFG